MSEILSTEAIQAMAGWPALDTHLVATHWDGCERNHPRCLAVKLIASHEALRALAVALAEALAEAEVSFMGDCTDPDCDYEPCKAVRLLLAKAREAGLLA